MKIEKKIRPCKPTRDNAIKAAKYARASDEAIGPNSYQAFYYPGYFSVDWYLNTWLYGSKDWDTAKGILESLVAEEVLEKSYKNYRLK